MSQEPPPPSCAPRWPQEGSPSSKDVSNPREKIMKIRSPVFLTTNSVPGNLPEVFTENDLTESLQLPKKVVAPHLTAEA